ncbi:MT-A70 family methyltransferase, partial [Mesorhizobium sp. M8A.F.Ca.ET.182.01.1.1]|uniref:MT-A70 family methyltransferase n=1 Tax=Mesorhizobium sp. M8A.F.Ca.ET.182.01.1.1 TaxID=2563964 RepID=UPI001FEFE5E3
WLNRALANLPAGDRIAKAGGLAVGPSTPLVIRGAAPVLGWAPQALPTPGDALPERVLDLYNHRDPVLAAALQKGLDADRMAMGDQLDSWCEAMAVEADVGRHSAKPDVFASWIERHWPNTPKIELNARQVRPGWDAWGNEAGET